MGKNFDSKALSVSRIYLILGLTTIALLSLGLLFVRSNLLLDPDTSWHIRVGIDMWNAWAFPTRDSYSFTFRGRPWITDEWLSQILLSRSFVVAGWSGVSVVTAVFALLGGSIFYYLTARHLRPIAAVSLTLIVLLLSSPVFVARPHVFTLWIVLVWTYWIFEAARLCRAPNFLMLLLLVLWANLHGSFTLGFVVAGFGFLDFVERTRLRDRRNAIRWLVFLIACPLVTFIHPYSYHAALMTLRLAMGNEAVPFISEWLPLNARDYPFHEWGLVVLAVGLLASGARFSLSKSLFAAAMLYLFLSHLRFVYLFFLLVPVVLVPDIALQFPRVSRANWATERRDSLEMFLAKWHIPIASVLSLVTASILGSLFIVLPTSPPPTAAPVSAIAYAKEHGLDGHVMNAYDFGGPLILNGIPTFIDGRTEQLFLNGFSENYQKMRQPGGETVFVNALIKYDIQWTLFQPNDPRNGYLEKMSNWKRVYVDDAAVIYKRVENAGG